MPFCYKCRGEGLGTGGGSKNQAGQIAKGGGSVCLFIYFWLFTAKPFFHHLFLVAKFLRGRVCAKYIEISRSQKEGEGRSFVEPKAQKGGE